MAKSDSSDHDAANSGEQGGLSEEELNEVLGKADALAAELARQLGTADVAVAPGDDKPGHARAENTEPDENLETELDELERLVAVAEEQLADPSLTLESDEADSEAPSVDRDPDVPPDPDGISDASDEEEVPDFMAEFTTADESATPVADKPADKPAAKPERKPGVVGTHMLGVVGSPVSAPLTQPPAPAEPEPQRANTTRSGALDRIVAAGAPLMNRCLSLATGISPLLLAGTERFVSWMELIHRPLPSLKETPRRVIGWVALATIGTSVIVFLLSLF